MATTRFKTTLDAIKGGVQKITIDKAVQNIEGWEEYLGKHDQDGVRAVVQDLGKLKKLLQGKEIDGEAVKKLIAKMGKDTVKVAGDDESADSKHIRELGEALSHAAENTSEEEEEDDTDEEEDVDDSDDEDEDEEDDEEEDGEEEDDEDEEDDELVDDEDEDDAEDAVKDEADKPAKTSKASPSKAKPAAKKSAAKAKK